MAKLLDPLLQYEFARTRDRDGEGGGNISSRIYAYSEGDEGRHYKLGGEQGDGGPSRYSYGNILGANSIEDWMGGPAWARRFNDEGLHGTLDQKHFQKAALADGYKGPTTDPFWAEKYILGMMTKDGKVLTSDFGGGETKVRADSLRGQALGPLMGHLQKTNPQLLAHWDANRNHEGNNDWQGMLLGGAMLGVGTLAAGAVAGAGGAATGSMAAADAAGLSAMGQAAGLSGSALDAFVASGGAMGSTAAGGALPGMLQAPLASEAGFVPGSFELGASGYPVLTAGQGLTAAGLESSIPGLLGKIPTSVLSQGLQAVLKYVGMNKMGSAYEDAANKFFAMSAPFQAKLLESYGPKFDLYDNPAYRNAFGRAADISTRAWSAKSGNPGNNPGIQANILDDVWTKSYIPALNDYRSGLMGGSSLGVNSATDSLLKSIPYSAPALSAGGDFLGGILESLPKQEKDDLTIGGVAYRG